jgi:hypothetical protein
MWRNFNTELQASRFLQAAWFFFFREVGVVGVCVCVMHLPYSICQRHFEVRNNAANIIWQPALRQLSKAIIEQSVGRVSTHVERFLGSGDWYPLVINLRVCVYIHIYRLTYPSVLKRIEFTHRFLKIKSRFGIYNCDSQKMMKKVRELPFFFGGGCWFFHENCQIFKVFEITGTNSSFILGIRIGHFFTKKIQRTELLNMDINFWNIIITGY